MLPRLLGFAGLLVCLIAVLTLRPGPLTAQGKDNDKDEQRLRQQVKKLQGEVEEWKRKWRDKDQDADAAQKRIKKLEDTVADLRQDVKERDKKLADAKDDVQVGEIQNPPQRKVSGTVKKLDAGGNVTISAGSDAGLRKGHTLEVYRDKPKRVAIGVLQLTDVRAKEAVGRLRYRPKGAPAVALDDLVADQLPASD